MYVNEVQAGIISINQARPQFSVSGPFNGWKASGFGTAEHGRWNIDFYTKVQTIYTYNPA
ncbi:MAG: aldehyde dehydrogenase [Sulfurimonas sp.]|nr:aldehyde dehydrogenase [Sulfurimonas sp.]MBU3939951.1 aldehyde dehydrogenase family protein [bacterium]MBU4025919.1 aldehyde dehydrogenase family protein [bacterium]MBU4058988.1 aldehyde dehydrogenase family protein [bacterium]MBU4111667.1 aldehyde dehydrogenase family protein [bacterium]